MRVLLAYLKVSSFGLWDTNQGRELTGLNLNYGLVEYGTLIIFMVCAVLSLWLNTRDWLRKRNSKHQY